MKTEREPSQLHKVLARRKCGSPPLVAEDGESDPGQCGRRLDGKKKEFSWNSKRKPVESGLGATTCESVVTSPPASGEKEERLLWDSLLKTNSGYWDVS